MIYIQGFLIACGCLFFIVGTLGLLRFPDTWSRIHALTKADNLGLGLIVLGVVPAMPSLAAVIKLLIIWLLVLAASATSSNLIARHISSGPHSEGKKRRDVI